MSEKECYHFTYLNRAFAIRDTGLEPRSEENSNIVKDHDPKISYSEGRYAAAFLMANFYRIFRDIKEGKRDDRLTDQNQKKKIMEASSLEEFLGDGMYLVFDGTNIENTGGNRGHINPFDAGTKERIPPEKLKVCLLRDEKTGELTYSKYDFVRYLMLTLSPEDYKKMPDNGKDILTYMQNYEKEFERFEENPYSIELMSLDDFCILYKSEIEADIERSTNQYGEVSRSVVSIKDVVSNAIESGTTLEDVKECESIERDEENKREKKEDIDK